MKRLTLVAAFLLLAVSARATLWNWTGTIDGRSDEAFGIIDVRGESLHNITLNINDLVWQGHETPDNPLLPYPGSVKTWLSDVPMDHGTYDESGDLIFSYQNPEDVIQDHWWFGFWDNNTHEVGGKIISLVRADANPTPEPSTFVLFGSALLGLGGFRGLYNHRRRSFKSLEV